MHSKKMQGNRIKIGSLHNQIARSLSPRCRAYTPRGCLCCFSPEVLGLSRKNCCFVRIFGKITDGRKICFNHIEMFAYVIDFH